MSDTIQGEKPTDEEMKEIQRILLRIRSDKRKEKLRALSTKGELTQEEKEWLRDNEQKAERRRALEREKMSLVRKARKERWEVLTSKETLTEEETAWLKKETAKRKSDSKKSIAWIKRNPEKVKQATRARYALLPKEKKAERIQKHGKWIRKRSETDPAFACVMRARRRVGKILRGVTKAQSARKGGCFLRYFGCDKSTLVSHIEGMFGDGMEWNNRGTFWELDHIVPISAGAGNEDLIFRLNHYKNLQPLTVSENRKKADRLPELWPEGVPFTREEIEESLRKIAQTPPESVSTLAP